MTPNTDNGKDLRSWGCVTTQLMVGIGIFLVMNFTPSTGRQYSGAGWILPFIIIAVAVFRILHNLFDLAVKPSGKQAAPGSQNADQQKTRDQDGDRGHPQGH
jgi:hypothetical protein